MTAGTSLSEAAVGRPSLLEAVACHPSLLEAAVVVISPSPAPSTGPLAYGTQNQHPPPISTQPPRVLPAYSTGTSTRCLHHPYGQHPASAPWVYHAYIQLTAPAPSLHHARSQRPHRPPISITHTTNSEQQRHQVPSTDARSTQHPVSATGKHQRPEPSAGVLSPPRAQLAPAPSRPSSRPSSRHPVSTTRQHRHPVSTTRTASSQHRYPASGASTMSPPRAQLAHSTNTLSPPRKLLTTPAPAPCLHHAHRQLTVFRSKNSGIVAILGIVFPQTVYC